MEPSSIINDAKLCISTEIEGLQHMLGLLDDNFVKAVKCIHNSKARLIVSGIGKSAIIAQKMVATFNSTGTPSIFLHAADAIHGDLGMVQPNDILMLISKSGETEEIKVLVPLLQSFGNTIIAICANKNSYLATQANFLLNTEVPEEACPNNLAPTSSTTAQLVMGDALAVCLLKLNHFSATDFARFHPGGALGKQLYLRVNHFIEQHEKPQVEANAGLAEIILEISSKRLGATAVLEKGILKGIITDGDLRRMMQTQNNFANLCAADIMNTHAKTIASDAMAVEALQLMRNNKINQLLIVDESQQYLGMVHLHDLIKEGIV